MSGYANTYRRQASPAVWQTTTYTIRRPGCTDWESSIEDYEYAKMELQRANARTRGHRLYAEQEYIGDLPELVGSTRTIEI